MDKYYKVPNVYIEEVSTSTSSISSVSSCVPVFIGYTEKAADGENDLTNKPTLITSLLDYQTFFGNPAPCNFIANVFQGEIFLELESQFLLYYTLRFFFDNGGSNCYIISVGNYFIKGQGDFQKENFNGGLEVLEYEDEPNLILLTDAINLKNEYYNKGELELGFWQEVEKTRNGDYDSIDLKELPDADDLSDTPYRPDNPNDSGDSGLIDVITVEVDSDDDSLDDKKSNGNLSKKEGKSNSSVSANGKDLSDDSEPKSVGAYYQPIEERSIQQLKDLCNGFGFTKEQLRKHGSLKQRDTYLKALQSVKNLLGS